MRHIDVAWIEQPSGEPYRLVSELDPAGYEVRKLEFFSSGVVGSASEAHVTTSTFLGEAPTPPLAEINRDPQFQAKVNWSPKNGRHEVW